MVDIQSKEVIDKISDELKVQPSLEIPRRLMDKIQLVYGVNPDYREKMRFATATRITTGASTILTSNTTKRTFLTGLYFNYQHDVVADSTGFTITATPIATRAVTNVVNLVKITLTAKQDRVSITFNPPMELAPNTSVVMNQTFTVGVGVMAGGVTFFETDPQ